MNDTLNRARTFVLSEDGPTITEYAVMLAAIVLVGVAALYSIGNVVQGTFSHVDNNLPTGV